MAWKRNSAPRNLSQSNRLEQGNNFTIAGAITRKYMLLNDSTNPEYLVAWTVCSAEQSSGYCLSSGWWLQSILQSHEPQGLNLFMDSLCIFPGSVYGNQLESWRYCILRKGFNLFLHTLLSHSILNNWHPHWTSEIKPKEIIHTENY